jgi:hypothetical protein
MKSKAMKDLFCGAIQITQSPGSRLIGPDHEPYSLALKAADDGHQGSQSV